jgi:exopolysaccharide biosynthesis polyprenyl glycosylphosphotransferase
MDIQLPGKSRTLSGFKSSPQSVRLRLYAMLVAFDLISLALGFSLAALFHVAGEVSALKLGFTCSAVYFAFAYSNRALSFAALENLPESGRNAINALAMAVLVIMVVRLSIQNDQPFIRGLSFSAAICGVLMLVHRHFMVDMISYWVGSALSRAIVVLDDVEDAADYRGYTVVRTCDLNIEPHLNDPQMLHRLGSVLRDFDRAIIACKPERRALWACILRGANITGEILVPVSFGLEPIGMSRVEGQQTMIVTRGPLTLGNRAQKRMLDIALTVPVLLVLAPLMLAVAIAIRIDSPGPIFFRQVRMGRGNRLFHILKFRSMYLDQCDAAGGVSTRPHDKRVTRVGSFIRATSIDELPQLINVLLGEMSLVGPRPHALGSRAGQLLFWEVDPQYWCRHALKPGITGLAQVRGFRGPTNHPKDLQDRVNADLEYISNWSVWRDVIVLASTVRVFWHTNAF